MAIVGATHHGLRERSRFAAPAIRIPRSHAGGVTEGSLRDRCEPAGELLSTGSVDVDTFTDSGAVAIRRIVVLSSCALVVCAIAYSLVQLSNEEPTRFNGRFVQPTESTPSPASGGRDVAAVPVGGIGRVGSRLRVRAIGPRGVPADSIRFEVRPASNRYYGQPGPPRDFRALDSATIEVEGLEAGSRWLVGAVSTTGELVGNLYLAIAGGDGAVEERDLDLIPAATIEGRVLDPEGAPVPGAEVRGWMPAIHPKGVQTDTEGRFRMTDAVGEPAIGARAVGYAPAYEVVRNLAPGATRSLEFALGRPWQLSGIAVDAENRPIRGTLMAWTLGEAVYTETDEGGRFVFDGLSARHSGTPTRSVVMEWRPDAKVAARTRVPAVVTSGPGSRFDAGIVQFVPSYLQDVLVVDPQGTPLPGVAVHPEASGSVSGADGRARFWLAEGVHRLAPIGYEPSTGIEVAIASLRVPAPVTLTVENAALLVGSLVYRSKERPRLDLLRVRVRPSAATAWRGVDVAPDGSFSAGIPSTWTQLQIEAGVEAEVVWGSEDGFRAVASKLWKSGDGPVALGISPADVLGVHIIAVEADGHTPVTRYRLGFSPLTWSTGVLTASDGRQDYFPLFPGEVVHVRVETPDGRLGDAGTVALRGDTWPTIRVSVER